VNKVGIIRKVDDLGRIVIPKELRRTLDLEPGSTAEVFLAEGGRGILLRPYIPGCIFCGRTDYDRISFVRLNGKPVCWNCKGKLAVMRPVNFFNGEAL